MCEEADRAKILYRKDGATIEVLTLVAIAIVKTQNNYWYDISHDFVDIINELNPDVITIDVFRNIIKLSDNNYRPYPYVIMHPLLEYTKFNMLESDLIDIMNLYPELEGN